MAKNPVLQKKYEEGYSKGFEHGIAHATDFFAQQFKGLENTPGIGEKTLKKIRKQLGEKYFKGVNK